MMRARLAVPAALVVWTIAAIGCGGDKKKNVDTEEGVLLAYQNFQPTILKITSAGLAAKGTASQGSNIPVIQIVGLVNGTGGVGGNVAQSGGGNENMNLWVELHDYSDTGDVDFQTDNTNDTTKLQFGLQIKTQPADNTMDGTLNGELELSGEVDGAGIFDLTTASDLDDDDLAPALICTHVTGSVTADGDVLDVDFVLPLGLSSALQATCASL